MGRTLITGIGGQDGFLLTHDLLELGRTVVGTVPPGTTNRPELSAYLGGLEGLEIVEHDVRDGVGFERLIETREVDEIYNLASLSSVGASWENAELVSETNGLAVLRMLEALRAFQDRHGRAPRLFQASSSEVFGPGDGRSQDETTPHHPRSPYAVAKCYAQHMVESFRESYGLFACSGILYNHESPLRGAGFVTRKITRAAAEIAHGGRESVSLGNLDVRRDWGHALDHVRCMRLMLEADAPADYVVGTGVSHSLEEFLCAAFESAGLGEPWPYVRHDPDLVRPGEVTERRGDATRAREQLGWIPEIPFRSMVEEMVRVDLQRVETGVEESPDYLPRR